jgi:hypothetical protein
LATSTLTPSPVPPDLIVYRTVSAARTDWRRTTYLIQANGRVDALHGLGARIERCGDGTLVKERALDQTHALRRSLTEGMVKET